MWKFCLTLLVLHCSSSKAKLQKTPAWQKQLAQHVPGDHQHEGSTSNEVTQSLKTCQKCSAAKQGAVCSAAKQRPVESTAPK